MPRYEGQGQIHGFGHLSWNQSTGRWLWEGPSCGISSVLGISVQGNWADPELLWGSHLTARTLIFWGAELCNLLLCRASHSDTKPQALMRHVGHQIETRKLEVRKKEKILLLFWCISLCESRNLVSVAQVELTLKPHSHSRFFCLAARNFRPNGAVDCEIIHTKPTAEQQDSSSVFTLARKYCI